MLQVAGRLQRMSRNAPEDHSEKNCVAVLKREVVIFYLCLKM